MSTMTDRNMAQEQADSYCITLEELWERIESDTHDADDARTELDELPLEIVWEKGEAFAVVLGTGGPHTEIVGGGRDGGYRLVSYWGGDEGVTRSDAITRTGEYFRELMEGGE